MGILEWVFCAESNLHAYALPPSCTDHSHCKGEIFLFVIALLGQLVQFVLAFAMDYSFRGFWWCIGLRRNKTEQKAKAGRGAVVSPSQKFSPEHTDVNLKSSAIRGEGATTVQASCKRLVCVAPNLVAASVLQAQLWLVILPETAKCLTSLFHERG